MFELKRDLRLITNLLSKAGENGDLKLVLEDLLTPQEIQSIAERIKLLQLLQKGYTQREIAKKLGISVTTVNRGSRILQFGKGKIKDFI